MTPHRSWGIPPRPVDTPDAYDVPGVERWSWRRSVVFMAAASLGGWAAFIGLLFWAGVLTW